MNSFFHQVPYEIPLETIQPPYIPLQGTYHSEDVSRASIASFDRNIHAAQEEHWDWMGPSVETTLTQPPVVLPAVQQQPLQIFPTPAPTPTEEWVQIPQRVYDLGRRQWNYRDSESIPFSVNGFPGINMHDALHSHFSGLDNRDELMFQDAAGAISCRLLFPGYPPNTSAQISTLNWTKNRGQITRSKLAYEVAKKLNRYLESMIGYPMDESVGAHWEIGEGFMRLENMFLVHLVPVSKGSFQPEIWVRV